jgi:hypothetical protein
MTRSLSIRLPSALILSLAVGLLLLPACRGRLGDDKVVMPAGCVLTDAELRGTWTVSQVAQDLTCPAGVTVKTTTKANNFSPVTVVRDESLPGFKITASGLTATVADDTCHIVWTYLDQSTNSEFDCYTTFHPDTRTAGGTEEAGHCSQITRLNTDGSTGASCALPPPYLDAFVVVTGS